MKSENNNKEIMDKTSKKTTTVKKGSKGKTISITKFKDLEGKFLHVKVGNVDCPATDGKIESIQEKLIALFESNNVNCLTFVTHHAVDMEIIEKDN
jgi:hypothetical protein